MKPAYPPEVATMRRQNRAEGLGCGLALLSLSLLLAATCAWSLAKGFGGLGEVAALAFAVWMGGGSWELWAAPRQDVRILPVYRRPLGGDLRLPLRGRALAWNWLRLERLAEERAALPLSTFLYRAGPRRSAWHDAEDGLDTVLALLREIPPGRVDDPLALQDDLTCLRTALERACRLGTRFALLVEVGGRTRPPHREI